MKGRSSSTRVHFSALRRLAITAAALATGAWTHGSCQPDYEASAARERNDVEALASSTFLGRGTPSAELDLAADYVAAELADAGFEPVADDYFQTYAIHTYFPTLTEFAVTIDGVPLDQDEYGVMPAHLSPAHTPLSLPVVYAGYGLADPVSGRDDFAGIDVAGRAVIVLKGAPWPLDPTTYTGFDHAVGKDLALGARGAAVMIYVSEELEPDFSGVPSAETMMWQAYASLPASYIPELDNQATSPTAPIIAIPPSAFDAHLAGAVGATFTELKAELDGGERRAAVTFATLSLTIAPAFELRATARNVVARKPGTDRHLAHEAVLLMAHYDHLGAFPDGNGNTLYFPGADDNASGTAAVLEAARLLSCVETRRSLLVVLPSGEELGLMGSAYFAMNAPVPFADIVASINLDIVGRSEGAVEVLAGGAPLLFDLFTATSYRHGLTVLPDQDPGASRQYRTDTYNLVRFGVTAVDLTTGERPDYHTPADVAANLRYDELARITHLAAEVAATLAVPRL